MIRNRIFENKFGGNLATQPDSKSFDLGQCHDLTRVSSLFGGRTNIEIARIAWGRRDELLHNEPHGREGRTTTTTTTTTDRPHVHAHRDACINIFI